MKRVDSEVAGRPKSEYEAGNARRDVAGTRSIPEWAEVASFHHALRSSAQKNQVVRGTLADPTAPYAEDGMLLDDFADFVGGEDDAEEGFAKQISSERRSNSDFRERLRARLWRTFVHSHLRSGGNPH